MDVRRRIIGGFVSGSSGGNTEPIDTDDYLTIYALQDGLTASLSKNACEYCVDGDGNWLSLDAGATTQSINMGQTLSFRGNLTPTYSVGIGTFTISKRCNLEGNCMSMLFGDNAATNLSLSGKTYAFYQLFHYCSNIVRVSENFLPATTLASCCYYRMFSNCSSLTTAPALPATTLTDDCYYSMFSGCTSLVNAPELPAKAVDMRCYMKMFYGCTGLTVPPELPATTLAEYCYMSMFHGCAGLTVAPELPATVLANYCYNSMFYGCNKLNYIKMLATDISASNCLYNWVTNVASTGTFVKNKLMTSLPTGVNGIPSGWTVIDDSSGSSATDNYLTIYALEDGLTASLSENACEYCVDGDGNWKSLAADTATESINAGHRLSFRGNLTPATNVGIGIFTISKRCNLEGNCMSMLFGDNAANNLSLAGKDYAFYQLFHSCSNIVRVSENFLPATTLAIQCYQYMFYGCTSLTTAPVLPATALATECYYYMFYNCTSLTTAPALPATTLASNCYLYMFYGCSKLTTAPALPATTLSNSCYRGMFYDCNKLNYIKMLATDISATNCLYSWVSGVSSNGTFVKHPNMTSLPTGTSGIPKGWTVKDDYTPTTCTSLTITADDVYCKDTTTTIYYTAVTNGEDSNGNIVNNVTITGTATSTPFAQNTSTTNTVQRTISYTYLGKTATTTITQDIWRDSYYIIDLNNQWQKSTTVSNPDTTEYDGVYESFSNYNVNSTAAIMKVTIYGYSSFKFYIRSYAESSWDYVMVSQLDQTINNNTSYSNTTLIKAHTRGNQQSGTALSNYTLVEFTNIDGGKHVITIVYRKDGSGNSGTDRGYVLIPKLAGDGGESGGESGGSVDINNYLTIVALEDGLTASLSTNACEYCIDGDGNWLSLTASSTSRSVNTGHTLSFRGNLTPATNVGIGTFTISKKCNLEGNCMSMLFGDNAANSTSLTGKDYAFYKLFCDCKNIVSVSKEFLRATTVSHRCYQYAFSGCSGLTNAPGLPATTLAVGCYVNMFQNCTSLNTVPPTLPAMALIDSCYGGMFWGCTSLTTAPALPALTLVYNCYSFMFYGCSKLSYIKMLATDIPSSSCVSNWVNGVASTGTFVKNPNMTSLPTGVSGSPFGWTVTIDGYNGDYDGQ